jgi:hypothetical protein
MKDSEVNQLAEEFKYELDVLYIIEFRKTEDPGPIHYRGTPNEERAHQLTRSMEKDGKYKGVLLHKTRIENTWEPVSTVELKEKTDAQG